MDILHIIYATVNSSAITNNSPTAEYSSLHDQNRHVTFKYPGSSVCDELCIQAL